MFSIGEFSKITGLTVKTLRFYHEEGILIPRIVDSGTGYRHYDEDQIETARAISFLRGLEFSLSDIKEILDRQNTGEAFLDTLERHKAELEGKVKRFRAVVGILGKFIADERAASDSTSAGDQIELKTLEPTIIAGIRMTGRYSDCGKAFGKIGRALGRYVSGKPFLLHYDSEFKEDDADFEACMPIRVHRSANGISVRELPGRPAISLTHCGHYEKLGRSYARVIRFAKQQGYEIVMPTREVYLKGPGIIFRGNPRTYLTEIQIPIEGGGGTL